MLKELVNEFELGGDAGRLNMCAVGRFLAGTQGVSRDTPAVSFHDISKISTLFIIFSCKLNY
jgi:hypothetical protein